MNLPSDLQHLAFGEKVLRASVDPCPALKVCWEPEYNQILEGVIWPANLQHLTSGEQFNQSIEHVTLPSTLKTLDLAWRFKNSLERVTLPDSIESLTLAARFDQNLDHVRCPANLRDLTFGRYSKSESGGCDPAQHPSKRFKV